MDPLSDVLALLKPSSFISGGVDHGGDWSLQFGSYEGIKFHAVISGECWLAVDGVAEPVHVRAGDCFLLPHGRPFRLASDLALPSIDAHSAVQLPLNGSIRAINGGGNCLSVGAHFSFAGRHAEILLEMLPTIVRLQSQSDRTAMHWALDRLMLESRDPQPGGALIAQHVASIMLVQAIRLHLADEGSRDTAGWLFALADKQIGASIAAVHDDPARRWTIQALAELACMSRSTFALKFKRAVGMSPMEYVMRWRMTLAADKLVRSGESIATLALALGYESESAFSTAFKRVMGSSPRQYSRRRA
jgi:AraC-like DNA-binding protein